MAIMDANYDQEMMRLWGIISDLSEQLNQHRATASALRNQAEGIKVGFWCGMDTICIVDPYMSVLEPRYPQPNGLRVAQVCPWPMSGFKLCSPYERQGLIWINHRVCMKALCLISSPLTDRYP